MNFDIIDLHTHSTCSDGTAPPAQLPAMAAKIKLEALALTDHDTVAGIPEFLEAAKEFPELRAIPGVEISTLHMNREIHILGLFLDHKHSELLDFLAGVQLKRRERNETMARKLADLGYDIDIETIRQLNCGQIIGRPHFANYLMQKYDFENLQDVFENSSSATRPPLLRAHCRRPLRR
jgi:hypothetical protein